MEEIIVYIKEKTLSGGIILLKVKFKHQQNQFQRRKLNYIRGTHIYIVLDCIMSDIYPLPFFMMMMVQVWFNFNGQRSPVTWGRWDVGSGVKINKL